MTAVMTSGTSTYRRDAGCRPSDMRASGRSSCSPSPSWSPPAPASRAARRRCLGDDDERRPWLQCRGTLHVQPRCETANSWCLPEGQLAAAAGIQVRRSRSTTRWRAQRRRRVRAVPRRGDDVEPRLHPVDSHAAARHHVRRSPLTAEVVKNNWTPTGAGTPDARRCWPVRAGEHRRRSTWSTTGRGSGQGCI